MQRLCPTKVDVRSLVVIATTLQYSMDAGYIDMAVTQSGGLPPQLLAKPLIAAVVAEISALRGLNPVNIMINTLSPGANVPKHRDWVKPTKLQPNHPARIERWHLPIKTNEKVYWWDEDAGEVHMSLGDWHGPVPYWLYHTVFNGGTENRIHIIVDLDCKEPVGDYRD